MENPTLGIRCRIVALTPTGIHRFDGNLHKIRSDPSRSGRWITSPGMIRHNSKKNHNSVNEITPVFGIDVSLGTTSHGLQVTSDHHHTTVNTQKTNIKIGTWDIRTLLQPTKLENIKVEMKRLNVNILDLGETRWTSVGVSTSDHCKFIHSG